jgi:hypothetical protein
VTSTSTQGQREKDERTDRGRRELEQADRETRDIEENTADKRRQI